MNIHSKNTKRKTILYHIKYLRQPSASNHWQYLLEEEEENNRVKKKNERLE